MHYRLRTLLIVLAIGPVLIAVVAGIWFPSAVLRSWGFWLVAATALYVVLALALGYLMASIISAANSIVERLQGRR
jgi:hypothetical protein